MKITVICACCEKEFEKEESEIRKTGNNFCSHSCSAKINNKGIRRVKETLREPKRCNNPECNKIFIPKDNREGKFCSSACVGAFLKSDKIRRFLSGKLSDNSIRTNAIRNYILDLQGGICVICGSLPFHFNLPLVFIVDHIDGDWSNSSPENIRVICPNCNSQTPTFTGRNKRRNKGFRHTR